MKTPKTPTEINGMPVVNRSNDLRYNTTKTVGKESITVNIRLNDECHNGHQDFSITGDIYRAGRPKTDNNFISGGCIHDDILKHFPQFAIFVRLHLCDYKGIPMHASANGFYHLRNGFNSKSTGEAFRNEYCEYYRITEEQFIQLYQAYNELQFSLMLQSLGILAQWEKEANEAIKLLESLTGTEFIIDSKHTQYYPPTVAELEEENQKLASGYYSDEAKAEREQAKTDKHFSDLIVERDKAIKKATDEYEAKKSVLIAGGKRALDNCIFYNHTNTIAFNWRGHSSDNLTADEITDITSKLILPDGVKWEISKNK